MDIFDTAVLNRVVQDLTRPSSFLLDTFFPQIQTEESEEIHFDTDDSKPRIAPFVSPLVAGKVQVEDGFSTQSFRPAYIKDKRRFEPNRPLKRTIGEPIGGNLSGQARMQAVLMKNMEDQLKRLTRTQEIMAAEALQAGQVTVAGEQYPTKVVDFGRASGLTVTKGASVGWDDSGVSAVDDLETWHGLIQDESGASARVVVMDPKAWQLARKQAAVTDLLDIRRGSTSSVNIDPITRGQGNDKARLVGYLGDFEIWVYQEKYTDSAGVTQQIMPDYGVIMGDPSTLEGARAYGMIQDEKAGYQALEYFAKSWLEEDPAVRYLLMQTAPLVVPYRPNACGFFTVKSD